MTNRNQVIDLVGLLNRQTLNKGFTSKLNMSKMTLDQLDYLLHKNIHKIDVDVTKPSNKNTPSQPMNRGVLDATRKVKKDKAHKLGFGQGAKFSQKKILGGKFTGLKYK